MKRIISVIAVMTVLLSFGLLVGCAEQPAQTDAPAVSQADAVSLGDVYAKVLETNVLPEMYILGDEYVHSYYGIAPEAASDYVFAVADDAMLADTLIIVRVSPNGDAAAIEEGFRRINQQRLQEMEAYNPEQYLRAENAVIGTTGDCVYYVISDDSSRVVGEILNNIG